MVGGQREAVDRAYAFRLAEAQGGRDPELEAQPHNQTVHRSCPRMAPQLAGQRTEGRAAASAEGPVRRLDQPPALPTRRPPQQGAHAARPLTAEGLRWSLFYQPKFGRHHPHARHGHRADSPARCTAEHVTHTRTDVIPGRAGTRPISNVHVTETTPLVGLRPGAHPDPRTFPVKPIDARFSRLPGLPLRSLLTAPAPGTPWTCPGSHATPWRDGKSV